ncbi:MAG TPA: CsgG/HfaB family protein [Thermodesulfovibrionales bacterium]|nr:CsgG/HfaB family protein [Thermodesulfovibrionales bacterium]
MKRIVLSVIVLSLVFASSVYAQGGNLRYSIMVSKFENRSNWSGQWNLAETFGAVLTDSLQQTGRFIVLGEKDMRAEAMAEQDFNESGRTAGGKKAVVKGQMTPAQLLVKGEITHFQSSTTGGGGGLRIGGFKLGGSTDSAEINAVIYVVDSTTGQVVASKKVVGQASRTGLDVGFTDRNWGADLGGFKKTNVGKAVEQAIDEAVAFISTQIEKIPWEGTVVMVKDDKVYINRGSREGVTPGQNFVIGSAEQLRDPDTGELLDTSIEKAGTVVIESVKEKISIGRPVEGADRIQKGMTVMLPGRS